jgi:hypothetical protein
MTGLCRLGLWAAAAFGLRGQRLMDFTGAFSRVKRQLAA